MTHDSTKTAPVAQRHTDTHTHDVFVADLTGCEEDCPRDVAHAPACTGAPTNALAPVAHRMTANVGARILPVLLCMRSLSSLWLLCGVASLVGRTGGGEESANQGEICREAVLLARCNFEKVDFLRQTTTALKSVQQGRGTYERWLVADDREKDPRQQQLQSSASLCRRRQPKLCDPHHYSTLARLPPKPRQEQFNIGPLQGLAIEGAQRSPLYLRAGNVVRMSGP